MKDLRQGAMEPSVYGAGDVGQLDERTLEKLREVPPARHKNRITRSEGGIVQEKRRRFSHPIELTRIKGVRAKTLRFKLGEMELTGVINESWSVREHVSHSGHDARNQRLVRSTGHCRF